MNDYARYFGGQRRQKKALPGLAGVNGQRQQAMTTGPGQWTRPLDPPPTNYGPPNTNFNQSMMRPSAAQQANQSYLAAQEPVYLNRFMKSANHAMNPLDSLFGPSSSSDMGFRQWMEQFGNGLDTNQAWSQYQSYVSDPYRSRFGMQSPLYSTATAIR